MLPVTEKLYTAAQVRALDQYAIEQQSMPGYTLMCRAGQAVFDEIRVRWPDMSRLSVFCGAGNNAGDGYVIARLAQEQGLDVCVWTLAERVTLTGDAQQAYLECEASKVSIAAFDPRSSVQDLQQTEIIVDALIGTGLQREVTGDWRVAVEQINASGKPVIAVDLPSGVNADTGQVMGIAIKAQCTITFIGYKRGLFTSEAVNHVGDLLLDSLQVTAPENIIAADQVCDLIDENMLSVLPPRKRATHKGHCGHVLVIGGNHGMSGAPQMAGLSALRSGAGLVSIAARGSACWQAELMAHVIEQSRALRPLLDKATVVLIGPGLGQDAWGQDMLSVVLESGKPMVIDADGLNLLAHEQQAYPNCVLTPHPGEAARLLNQPIVQIQSDRFSAVTELHNRWGGVVVLKGPGTLIAGERTSLCPSGNPGMATAGMGDVLAGVIAGLIAQGLALEQAAQLGVWLHATAADREAAEQGERGMLATDLLPQIRRLVNGDAR